MNNNKWQVTEFHGNGSKKTEQLSLGRLVKVKKYFEGGELQLEGDFIDGKPEGLHVIYFQSGGIHMTTNYVSGVQEGEEVKYYESGEKFHVANCKNGKYEGKFTAYYKNGNVQSTISLVKGSRLGETIDYYESGSIRAVRDFSSHDVQEATVFYENGVIQSKATLINDELDGVFEGYDENGKLAIRQIYKQGELIGGELSEGPQSSLMQDKKKANISVDGSELETENSNVGDHKTSIKYYVIYIKNADQSNPEFLVFEIIDFSFIVPYLLSKKYDFKLQELLKNPKDYLRTALKPHLIAKGERITSGRWDSLPDNPFEPTEEDQLVMDLSDFNRWSKHYKDLVKCINLDWGSYSYQSVFRLKNLNHNQSTESIALIDEIYSEDGCGELLSKIVKCEDFKSNIALNFSLVTTARTFHNRDLRAAYEPVINNIQKKMEIDMTKELFLKSLTDNLKTLGIKYKVGLKDFDDFILFYTIINNSYVIDLVDSDSYDHWKRYKKITKLKGQKWSLPFLDRSDFIKYLFLIKEHPKENWDEFFEKRVCKYCQSATPKESDVCQFCLYEEKINDFDLLPNGLKGEYTYFGVVVSLNARIRDLKNNIAQLQWTIKSSQEYSKKWYHSDKKNSEVFKANNSDKFQKLDDMLFNLEKTKVDLNKLLNSRPFKSQADKQSFLNFNLSLESKE